MMQQISQMMEKIRQMENRELQLQDNQKSLTEIINKIDMWKDVKESRASISNLRVVKT